MALDTPTWLQNGTYSARLDRIFADVLFTEGVMRVSAGDLLVTERGAGTNNSVDIAAGRACITGDDSADQGNYLVRNTATVNLAATAAPVSNSRIDLVCVRINDSAAGGPAGDDAQFVYVTGTAAVSPTPPAVPTSAIALAQVLRTAGDTQVVNANITDVRGQSLTILSNTLTTAGDLFSFDGSNATRIGLGASGLPLVAGPTAPGYAQLGTPGIANGAVTNPKLGTNAIQTTNIADLNVTTNKLADLSVTTAKIAATTITAGKIADEAFTPYAPIVSGISVGAGAAYGRYHKVGNIVHFHIDLTLGGGWSITAPVTLQTPTAAYSGAGPWQHVYNVQFVDVSGSMWYPGQTRYQSASSFVLGAIWSYVLTFVDFALSSTVPFTFDVSDRIFVSGWYEEA